MGKGTDSGLRTPDSGLRRDFISGGALVVLGGAVWVLAETFPALPEGYPGPALFPRLIAAGLGFAGLGIALRGYRRRSAEVEGAEIGTEAAEAARPHPAGAGRLALALALVALYPAGISLLGFIPTLALIIFGVALLLRARVVRAALTAVGAAALIYGIFTGLLGVPL